MAQATEILAVSQKEGASVLLIYDDQTLIASGVECSVSASAVGAMTVKIVTKKGFSASVQVQPSQFNQVTAIPANFQPTGVRATGIGGVPTIDWGLTVAISFG